MPALSSAARGGRSTGFREPGLDDDAAGELDAEIQPARRERRQRE
jgi:hypothetical protein